MLLRHILGYGPANIVPAVVSFLSIYVFTRLISPEAYGAYALAISVSLLCQAVFFYWLQVGATRFVARAAEERDLGAFTATIYRAFAASSAALAVVYATVMVLLPHPSAMVRHALWLGLALVLARSLTAVSQSFNRGSLRVGRYNLIECGQSLLGFGFGLVLVVVFHREGQGILLGLIAGAAVMAVVSLAGERPLLVGASWAAKPAPGRIARLLAFGLPLTIYNAMNFVLSTSDRLLVDHFLGAAAVGVYSVSYNVMDRALTSVFLAVSLAAFPLAVNKLEREGPEAARRQLSHNATALLALALPACAGLIALQRPLAAILIGDRFRPEALQIMPFIALASLLAGFQIHFFDHAFSLGKRTHLLVWSVGPAAVLNVVLNIVLLPRLGLRGAAYATLASYGASLVGSIVVGRRSFAIDFPLRPLIKIGLCTCAMLAALRLARFPPTALGLCALIALGAATYAAAAVVANVGGVRTLLWGRWASGQRLQDAPP